VQLSSSRIGSYLLLLISRLNGFVRDDADSPTSAYYRALRVMGPPGDLLRLWIC
jgi:hypothetical protein